MWNIPLIVLIGAGVVATATLRKEECPSTCQLPHCLCASSDPPNGLHPKDIPQFVLLTFDDAVNSRNMKYYTQAFEGRTNPDNCPITTTYFVSHEYTEYRYVHDLASKGHEIALHSITHQTPSTYWQELSVEGNHREFVDEADLISHFAKIPKHDIKGIRLPFLQMNGNNSFQMLAESNLEYDCSWPTLKYIDSGLFPYTLDYESPQDCPIGPCPTVSIPGVWVMPMVDWRDTAGISCAMVDACINIPTDVEGILQFMKNNFLRHYTKSRSPFGFYVHAAWFELKEAHFEAYLQFLDYLKDLPDVYMVSAQTALEWMKNPMTAEEYKNKAQCKRGFANTCGAGQTCVLKKEQEDRYVNICADSCPNSYPWLNNPLGE